MFQEESPQHWYAEGKRCPEDILQECRPLLQPVVDRIGFDLFCRHHRADVFQEVHATFFAGSALALLMPAGWALKAKCGVAARAKSRHQAHRCCALRAFRHGLRSRGQGIARRATGFSGRSAAHTEILPGRESQLEQTGEVCILGVNPDLQTRAFPHSNLAKRAKANAEESVAVRAAIPL
jgi:hypothetical protein